MPADTAKGRLTAALDALVAVGAPGAAAIVANGTGRQEAARGYANLATLEPMRPELRFRAGSMTKTFVAAEILRLVARNAIGLEDTLGRLLPDVPPVADHVTVRQLLNHTGGVPDNTAIWYRAVLESPEGRFRQWKPRELVEIVADQPLAFPPGTDWAYSNTGYVMLGLIIEAITGASLASVLLDDLARPLGLSATSLPGHETELAAPAARGYAWPRDANLAVRDGPLIDFTEQDTSYAWAAGGIVSSLPDLIGFTRQLVRGGVVPEPLLAEMLTTVSVPRERLPVPLFDRYGLGIIEVDAPNGPLVGQAGGILGYFSMVLSTPDGAAQLGLMINAGDAVPKRLESAFLTTLAALGSDLHREVGHSASRT